MATEQEQSASAAEKAEASVQPVDGPTLPNHEGLTWDGPDDPENPYNWPSSRKVLIGIVYSTSQLVTTMSASMIAPALNQISRDLGMSPSAGQIAFSVFFLGLGFAPFMVAALAETYGRKPVWVAGNLWYILWNALCPVGNSAALMIVGRLMCASGASVGVTLTAPALSDMFRAKDRGQSIAIAGLLPYVGPALGPIVGGVTAQHIWWPWLFWILSLFDTLCLGLGILFIRETYTPVLLRRKARRIRRLNGTDEKQLVKTKIAHFYGDVMSKLVPAITKTVRLFTHRPIIQVCAVALGVDFGTYTLVISTFASLWTTRYGQSETISSLHYIAIALGAFSCAQVGGRLMDFMWRRMKAAQPEREPTPEYRVPYIIMGLIPATAGLFCYAWAAQNKVHWVVVDVGIFVFCLGSFMFSQGILAYQIDEFSSTRAASASAASRLWSYIIGFAFPIFAPQLYATLDYGWGTSLLAFLFLTLSAPTSFVLWFWGPKLRAVGRRPEDVKERLE